MHRETSKQKRRRHLRSRVGLERLIAGGTQAASNEDKRRTAWLMYAVHAFRATSMSDDRAALKHRAELCAMIPKQAGCGACAGCQAVSFAVASFDLADDEHAVAARCASRLAPAVRQPVSEVCGTCGIVMAAAATLALQKQGVI